MKNNELTGFNRHGNGKKILFACVPADGHFNPLTGLAVHLQHIGYDVRWYAADTYEHKVKKLNIPYYPFKKAFEGRSCEKLEEMFPDRENYKSQIGKLNYDLVHVFIRRAPEYFEDIQEIHKTFPFDLMIADVTFGAIPLVKEKMGIPVIGVGIVPLMEASRDLGPAGLGLVPATGFFGRRKQDLMRFFADHVIFRKSNQVMRQVFRAYGIKTGNRNVFDSLTRKSSLLLQSGTPGFEFTRSDLGKNIRFIGPLLPYTPARKDAAWHHPQLQQYKKIILVTQGTVEKDAEKLIVPTLEAFKDTDHLVIVTTGGSQTAELRRRYPSPNILIEDFIPFDDIMPHCDVYVTNGGYGGVLLGIKHKLPLVVAGIHEGKLEINARVGYFKLGVNLQTEKPTAEQLRQGVSTVLADKTYHENVVKLAREFSKYEPAVLCAGYVAELLQQKHGRLVHTKKVAANSLLAEN